ncbi:collagen binding domain-containing protein [Corallococcus sp. Z5C101001]|uniref:MSCRAMM family protein n=1 Tax=Corallococcus sp. Z5C101001 TaxID=2596829 RepID=UPI00117CFF38|nr:carboxypeptidase regulatory-like domain-containing protein [Corallococcus sp. Z5C101001]TSC33981.1 hypothetical protein FOF48_02765 [Corallococcus sp. Z5C101001]
MRAKRVLSWAGVLIIGLGVALLSFPASRTADTSAPQPHRDADTRAWGVFLPRLLTSHDEDSRRIRGVVRDVHGPVAGARVSASRVEPEVTLSERSCPPSDSAPAAPGGAPPRLMECWEEAFDELVEQVDLREGEAPIVAETLSAEDGTFVLDGLLGGEVTLQATSGQGVAMRTHVAPGREGVVLALEEGLFFEGIVTNPPPEREPIPEARITVFSRESTRFFPGTSGTDGRFRIGPVPPAGYAILVTAGNRSPLLRIRANALGSDTFILDPSARYAGQVVTATGAPAPGLPVKLYVPSVAPAWRTTVTDAQGRFAFRSVDTPPGHLFVETTEHGAFAHIHTEPREDLRLTLGPGLFVEGTVRDESGSPVPGARVQAQRLDEDSPSPRGQTVTDAKGHYRLGPLYRLPHFVGASAPRHVPTEPKYQEFEEDAASLDFTLQRAVTVEGVLVDEEGQPLADRELLLHLDEASSPAEAIVVDSTRSDAAGRFVLGAAEEGPAWIEVQDAAFIPQRFPVERPSREGRLVARKGASVSVTVLGTAGAPVGDARVTLWKRDARGEAAQVGETDVEGQVLLQGIPVGAYVAEATVPGRALDPSVTQPLDVTDKGLSAITLRLREGRTLRGVVVNAQGLPLRGVGIRADIPDGDQPHYIAATPRMGLPPEGVLTDAEGRFTLRQLSAPRYMLTVKLQGHVLDASGSQGIHPGDEDTVEVSSDAGEVRLLLRRIPHVRGSVIAEGGEALDGFAVNGRSSHESGGRFDHPLFQPMGPQRLVVEARGFATVNRIITPVGGEDVDVGTITLTRGRTLRVFLRDAATGEPFNGRVRDNSGEWATVSIGYWIHGESTVDGPPYLRPSGMKPWQDGGLLLEHVPTTPFTLEVRTQMHLPLRVAVGAAEKSITVSLDPGARVTGHVRDAKGQPLAAWLTFTRSDGTTLQRNLEPGDFAFHGIPPDLYTVNAHPSDTENKAVFPARTVRIPPSGDVLLAFDALGTGATVELRLPEDADTALLMPGQVPAPGDVGALEHLRLQQHPVEEWRGTAAVFSRVPAGHYTLIVGTRGKDRFHREELDVPAEGTRILEVKPVWTPLAR